MTSPDTSTDVGAFAAGLLERFPACTSVALADPDDPSAPFGAGDLVLGVGIAAAAAPGLLTAAGAGGAAAVLLRRPHRQATAPAAGGTELDALAAAQVVPLCWLGPEYGWNELHRQLLDRLSPPAIRADDELADLAQTIATLTGGLVTIEDTSARVLAYSRSSDEVDDLRRLSILGRSGPADYLALLREWGVYDRLSSSEEVVEIAEHPESGVRRRLAVGVFAGDRPLGTIWVQQGSAEFGQHAEQALLGAARITAAQLVSRGSRRTGSGTGLAALLGATTTATGPAGLTGPTGLTGLTGLGRAARQPCVVAVAELGPATRDAATTRLQLDELATIVTVHAAAYRRGAMVEQLDGRVYLLIPALDPIPALDLIPAPDSADRVTILLRQAVAAVRRHLDPAARAAVGPVVESVAAAAQSRRGADLALSVAGTDPVLAFDAARPRLLTSAIENVYSEQPHLLHPRISALVAADPDGARTLLNYLDAGSDVARVAAELHLHPTTVRYRLRRALERSGIKLSEPWERFAVHVQLRCGLRPGLSGG